MENDALLIALKMPTIVYKLHNELLNKSVVGNFSVNSCGVEED